METTRKESEYLEMRPDNLKKLGEMVGIIEEWQLEEMYKPVQFSRGWHICTCEECSKIRNERCKECGCRKHPPDHIILKRHRGENKNKKEGERAKD